MTADGVGRDPDGVAARVREAVAVVRGSAVGEQDDGLRFYDDLGFDSVNLMELKFLLEGGFPELGGLSLPEMLTSLVSIGSLVEYLSLQLAAS